MVHLNSVLLAWCMYTLSLGCAYKQCKVVIWREQNAGSAKCNRLNVFKMRPSSMAFRVCSHMTYAEQDPIQIRYPLSSPVLTIEDVSRWCRQAKHPIVPR